MTVYYSQERAVIPTIDGVFYYTGPADYSIQDYSSKIWSQGNEPYGQVGVNDIQTCDPDIDRPKYFNYSNLYFELLKNDGTSVNFIGGFLDSTQYREYKVSISNITRVNCTNSLYSTVLIYGNYRTDLIIKDSYITNSSSVFALEFYAYFRKVTVENMIIEKSDALAQYTMAFLFDDEVELKNVTVNDCDFTGTDSTGLFYFLSMTPSIVTVSDLYITNSKLGYRSGFVSDPIMYADLSLSNLYFENVTLNTDAALIKTGIVNSLSIAASTFTDVKQANANDNSNTMIELGSLILDSGNNFVVTNLTAQQSSVALLKVTSVVISSSVANGIQISGITYKDSVFEYHQDLIIVNDIEEDYEFDIIISGIDMSGLTFNRDGNLLYLEHQTFSGLQLHDATFNNIKGGSIYLASSSLLSTSQKTKLNMSNITVDGIIGRSSSFISINDGGELGVQDSVFINSYNLEGGAIAQSSGQTAVASFTNCIFMNNSALYGGVSNIEERGVIKFYNSTFANNFAPQAGVIQLRSDGYIELYECIIQNNYAISAPVIELFITSSQSIISNSSIISNVALSKEEVLNEFDN